MIHHRGGNRVTAYYDNKYHNNDLNSKEANKEAIISFFFIIYLYKMWFLDNFLRLIWLKSEFTNKEIEEIERNQSLFRKLSSKKNNSELDFLNNINVSDFSYKTIYIPKKMVEQEL